MMTTDMAANCPPAAPQLHHLERQIDSGAEFSPPLLIVPGPRGHVEVSDAQDPSNVMFDPAALRAANGRVVGYAALEAMGSDKSSRVEVLCADDAEVHAYIGSRVTEALHPEVTRVRVRAPHAGEGKAGLVGDNGYKYAFLKSQPGGVSAAGSSETGGIGTSQSGGVSPDASETGGVSSAQ